MCTVDVRNQRSVAAAGERRVPGGSRRCGRESNADADRMRRMRRHYRCTTVLVDETGRAPRRREPRGETSPLRPGCRGAMTVWARARGGQDPAVLVTVEDIHTVCRDTQREQKAKGARTKQGQGPGSVSTIMYHRSEPAQYSNQCAYTAPVQYTAVLCNLYEITDQ